jgi:hypothetical protein
MGTCCEHFGVDFADDERARVEDADVVIATLGSLVSNDARDVQPRLGGVRFEQRKGAVRRVGWTEKEVGADLRERIGGVEEDVGGGRPIVGIDAVFEIGEG